MEVFGRLSRRFSAVERLVGQVHQVVQLPDIARRLPYTGSNGPLLSDFPESRPVRAHSFAFVDVQVRTKPVGGAEASAPLRTFHRSSYQNGAIGV